MEKPVIYLDHNATTPVLPEVREVMIEAMKEFWGNPSSIHSPGRKAFARLETARARLAGLIDASPKEIFFTSGGTESDNLARRQRNKIFPWKRKYKAGSAGSG